MVNLASSGASAGSVSRLDRSHPPCTTRKVEPGMNSPDSEPPPTSLEKEKYSTRRDFLLQLGVAINTIAAFLIGLPIVGFIFSTLIKHTPRVWISLGPASQ